MGQTALVLMGGAGCDKPRAAVGRVDAPTHSTAADTVVRRVVRVRRDASAIQRVTGHVRAIRALERLDSILSVRVLDQRGRELADVAVSWSIRNAGDGAELSILNARTDSLGISRANFTPGSSAAPQVVVAEVTGVGRIPFAVTIPPASIRLIPERPTIWSGDTAVLTAELRDIASTTLAGASLTWATTDSTVARVISRGDHGIVRGSLAGSADIVAWIEPGTVRTSTRVRVKPVVNGRFITVDASAAPSLRAELRVGASRESLTVRDGAFSARIDIATGQDAELIAAPETAGQVHDLRISVSEARALQNLNVALVPTRWRIRGGTYDGQEVGIDAPRALRRVEGAAAFWRLVPISGRGPKKLLGWPESSLPLRIAFNRARSNDHISPEDSLEFWRIAAQMERDLGRQFFVSAEMSSDTAARDFIPVEIGSNVGAGHAFVSWNSSGDAFDATLTFRTSATLRDAHVVTHELLHLLGFGHTSAWPSVLRPSGGTERQLTPHDVAYTQLAMRLRQLQHETGARPGLPQP